MTLIHTLPATERVLAASLVALTAATILLAAETHAFCNLFCIHGTLMVGTDICAGRG